MTRSNSRFPETEPLVVPPRVAWQMLGCSNTKGYELLKKGELESFKDGRSRKITTRSIRAYIERQLAAQRGERPSAAVTALATVARAARRRPKMRNEGAEPSLPGKP